MEHVIVFAQTNHFAGWPANNGLWTWPDGELVVGFTLGAYRVSSGHNILPPYRSLLARSLDGGLSWEVEKPVPYVGRARDLAPLPEPVRLDAPGFAMRVVGVGYHGANEERGGFFLSTDRCRTWRGPYAFAGLGDLPQLAGWEWTPRTDYLVVGPDECLVFLSARPVERWGSDRAFCARTADGGRTFSFLSWVVPPSDPYRAVMPSTVRPAPGRLVSALRRREMGTERCWIDAYGSEDGGARWSFLSRVGETGGHNGNPPALARLRDGRLCCAYGRRDRRQIVARLSADEGRTWGAERVLREDYFPVNDDADLGYPRVAQRADGRLVTIYYWATRDRPEQHIAATIWDPDCLV
jgi:hypothetical protein